jgi:AraC-like DNA-binding protein
VSAPLVPGTLWLADGGALRCRSARSLHVLPPALALWIPEGVPHEAQGLGGARLRRIDLGLGIDASMRTPGAAPCRVTLAGPLLKALAGTLDGVAEGGPMTTHQRLALALAAEELQSARALPIGIALPCSPALRAACEAALDDGACTLEHLADAVHTSARTLARRFRQELELPFSHWRWQVRLARLVGLWAEGLPLSECAAAVGYASASALSYRVRQALGMTPSRLLAG